MAAADRTLGAARGSRQVCSPHPGCGATRSSLRSSRRTHDGAPSCAVDLAFTREATLAWSDEQIYAWVVRDGTERAALVSPDTPTQEAQIWVVDSLDVAVAVLDSRPSGPSQELVSWDAEGEVTDVVPGPSRGDT